MTTKLPLALLAILILGPGCTGALDDPAAAPTPRDTPEEPVASRSAASCGVSAAPFRRLTRVEYDNTVRDLLGDTRAVAAAFPEEDEQAGFAVGGTATPLAVESYMQAAVTLAERATENLTALLPCDPSVAGEEACAASFIEDFGLRAYRRPLEPAIRDRILAVYRAGREGGGFEDGIRVALAAMLQSPWFLYLVDSSDSPGAPGEVVPLDGWSRASRLSYLIWDSGPDEALLEAAAAGELDTPDGVEAHARRLLDDPRAREAVRRFFVEWLHLDVPGVTKDESAHPEFDDALWESMREDTRAFLDWAIWEQGTLEALLTAPYAFVDAQLAELYGVAAPAGDGRVAVALDPSERAGVLTQASVMTVLSNPDETSPILRGLLVRERLLCQSLPPPPPDIPALPEPDGETTTRERLRQHRADPACAGCHDLIDPIGYAFERYDPTGRIRTKDNGFPIDDSGFIEGTASSDGRFTGAVELANQLADSDDVRRCLATQWFRYAFARLERDADACSLEQVYDAFEASGWDLRELLVALARSDAFLYRRVPEDKEAP